MINLLSPEHWTSECEWGNAHAGGFTVFTDDNVHWKEGKLILSIKKKSFEGWYMRTPEWIRTLVTGSYTGGRLISKMQFLYGTFIIKCILPDFRGSFPAWWLYDLIGGSGVPPEIDIFEHFRKDRFLTRFKTTHTYHDTPDDAQQYSKMTCKAHWHWRPIDNREMTFMFNWLPDRMEWFCNDKLVLRILKKDVKRFPDRPMNLQINSGAGNWRVQDDKLSPLIITEMVKV